MTIEDRPPLGLDLAVKETSDVSVTTQPELLGDEILRAIAHAALDVAAIDDEVLSVVATAAHDDVDMRVVGVPVIDRSPIKLGVEILFRLCHQLAGELPEVRHVDGILWRDDEAEVMPIVLAAFRKIPRVYIVRLRPEQAALLVIAGNAVAAQVIQVTGERRAEALVADYPRLDGAEA